MTSQYPGIHDIGRASTIRGLRYYAKSSAATRDRPLVAGKPRSWKSPKHTPQSNGMLVVQRRAYHSTVSQKGSLIIHCAVLCCFDCVVLRCCYRTRVATTTTWVGGTSLTTTTWVGGTSRRKRCKTNCWRARGTSLCYDIVWFN